jgi:hypothetical protein
MDDRWTLEVRAIFGDPPMPGPVWEAQFDGCQEDLEELARTPWQEVDYDARYFWSYYHDLTYVELQPDLFRHAFPHCLARWRHTFMLDEPAARGDADFHRALYRGKILDAWLDPHEKDAVLAYFVEGFFERFDAQPIADSISDVRPTFTERLNSLCKIVPFVDRILPRWFACETPSRSMCFIYWLSQLMEDDSEEYYYSPLDQMVEDEGSICDAVWLADNLEFFDEFVDTPRILATSTLARKQLAGSVAEGYADGLAALAERHPDFVEARIADLRRALATPMDWQPTFHWTSRRPS